MKKSPLAPTHTHLTDSEPGATPDYAALVRALGHAVGRLMRLADTPAQEFFVAYKMGLLDALLEENPRMSIAELSIRSGIDRRQISEYLKQNTISEREKRNKIVMVLEELKRLREQHYPDGLIPRRGSPLSFDAVCQQYANGDYSPGAILRELVRRGNAEDLGNHVSVKSNVYERDKSALDFLSFSARTLNLFVNTTLSNFRINDFSKRSGQRTIYSTQIPLEKTETVHEELKLLMQKHYKQYQELLSHHEADVTAGTFEPIGVSLFQFAPSARQTNSRQWAEDE
jgi:hypothetical protein